MVKVVPLPVVTTAVCTQAFLAFTDGPPSFPRRWYSLKGLVYLCTWRTVLLLIHG